MAAAILTATSGVAINSADTLCASINSSIRPSANSTCSPKRSYVRAAACHVRVKRGVGMFSNLVQEPSATHQDSGSQASVCNSAEDLLFIFSAKQPPSTPKDPCKSMVLLQWAQGIACNLQVVVHTPNMTTAYVESHFYSTADEP